MCRRSMTRPHPSDKLHSQSSPEENETLARDNSSHALGSWVFSGDLNFYPTLIGRSVPGHSDETLEAAIGFQR